MREVKIGEDKSYIDKAGVGPSSMAGLIERWLISFGNNQLKPNLNEVTGRTQDELWSCLQGKVNPFTDLIELVAHADSILR